MMAKTANTLSLLEKVRQIAPVIREHTASSERDRQLAKPVVDALLAAGLFRMWIPKQFGGMEVDPVTAMCVFQEVSRLDSAAGWNLQLSNALAPFFAWFPDEGAEEIFGASPDVILGGTLFPPGQAVPVEGGYRLTGRWPFVSGCHHCSWFLGPTFIIDGDRPRLSENGDPVQMIVAYPAKEAEILDTWHTMGMRGTGSHDVAVKDVFIPHRRTALLAPLSRPGAAFKGSLYRLTIWPPIAALAAPALGIARAAIDAVVDLGKKKTPNYARSPLRERPVVQTQVAHAEALLGAGQAYLHESLREAWDAVAQGQALVMKDKIKIQLATSYAIRAAADAVELAHQAAGTTAIRQENALEKHFRDAHVITQHAFGSTSRYESVGKLLFDLETDWGFFAL